MAPRSSSAPTASLAEAFRIRRDYEYFDRIGSLGRQAALILGDFSDCLPTNTSRYPYSMDEVVDTLRGMLPFPVLTGLPFGHVARKTTLPFGAALSAELNVKS